MVAKAIPLGYTAKGVYIYADSIADNDMSVKVYQKRMSLLSYSSSALVTGATNTYLPFSAEMSTEDNYILVHVDDMDETSATENDDFIFGGYIDISPILTPELIVEGATSEDGLFRG